MRRSIFALSMTALAVIVGYILYAGSRLPKGLKDQIGTEITQLTSARKTVADQQTKVASAVQQNPELFRVRGFDTQWQSRFAEAQSNLNAADRDAAELTQLRERNSRSDRRRIEQLLAREREERDSALAVASGIVAEADKRVRFKQNFSSELASAEKRVIQLKSNDYSWLTPKIEKAERDWPAKKDDLASRLNAIVATKEQAADWQQSIDAIQAKPVDLLTAADYASALDLQEKIEAARSSSHAKDLDALRGQLYTSWDDILEDLDKSHGQFREQIKHVVTTVSAPGDKGSTSSQTLEKEIPEHKWRSLEDNIGMAVAHKPLGKFDSEADLTPEPPGFAYMASPAEGRNQYGYWANSGGTSVWHWLPEYLILSNLLSRNTYVPVPSYDWNRYHDYHRMGRPWYGSTDSGEPKYGSHGTFTQRSYSGSRYVQSGGFGNSKYASKSGGFAGSKYGSGGSGSREPSMSSGGKKYGSGSSSFGSKSYGRSSGRSFGGGSRSGGRSFGGRR
jgi:hypothetical protein